MNTIEHHEGIYEIKNFIDKDTIDFLLSKINVKDNEGWHTESLGNNVFFSYDEDFVSCVNKINNSIVECFKNIYDSTGIQNIRRLKSGEFMNAHFDSGMPPKNTNPREDDFTEYGAGNYIVFGIVLYLNDEFKGGETFYRDIDLKIKPTVGSLIIHKSNILHEVLEIKDGERYSISSFIKGNEDTSFIFK